MLLLREPRLNPEQIEQWIREGASKLGSAAETTRSSPARATQTGDFDFKKARQALQRARTKTSLRGPKPLRRIRTNQAAVNEGLIDALTALLAVNKAMAGELNALRAELAEVRATREHDSGIPPTRETRE